MGEQRGALRGLRVLMWVVIAVEVPVYLVWLVQVGYLTGHDLPRGDVARWAPPVLLPPVAVLFCVMAGWTWWLSVVARNRSPLWEKWIVASLVFVAVSGVLRGGLGRRPVGVGGPAEHRRDRARHGRAVLHPGRRLPSAAGRRPSAFVVRPDGSTVFSCHETLSTTLKTAHPQQLVDDILRVVTLKNG
ncbi:hypothetical protein ACIP3A_39380 [Streptomyces tricolor]|uniref:hypothetical protein n=1 Tax=Streptomyces tricolor TaxID=68277 RepID=UPI00380C2114